MPMMMQRRHELEELKAQDIDAQSDYVNEPSAEAGGWQDGRNWRAASRAALPRSKASME